MATDTQVNRRRFLQLGSAALWGASFCRCGIPQGEQYSYFTPEEALVVIAITDQIIPADEDPGARWAGVIQYIDRQVAGPFAHQQEAYRQGLQRLDLISQTLHDKAFIALGWDVQTALLESLEAGAAPEDGWPASEQRNFFRMVRDHTMQGFYGGPQHGGNRDFVSWRMLGLPYPQVRGQNRYHENPAAKA